jgi:hypothetical protein
VAKTRNHVVPKFLLKQFAVDGHVMVVLRDGAQRPASIRSAAVEEHFYSFKDAEGRRLPLLEDYLDREVENLAAPAIKRIVEGAYGHEDMSVAGRFLVFQLVRSPRFRTIDIALAATIGPLLAGIDHVHAWKVGSPGAATADDDTLAQVFEEGRANADGAYTSQPDANSHVRLLILTAERLLRDIEDVQWALAVSDTPGFITSDSPAVVFNPTIAEGGFAGFSAGSGNEFRLPLSPRHLLVGCRHHLGPTVFAATTELIADTNRLLARECSHAIIVPPGLNPPGDPRPGKSPPTFPEPTVKITASDSSEVSAPSYPLIRDPQLRKIVERTYEV